MLWQQTRLPVWLASKPVDLFWSPIHTLPPVLPVPGVVTVHDLSALACPALHTFRHRLSVLPFLAASLARAERIVAISQFTASEIRRFFPRCSDKIQVIYNGVAPGFRPAVRAEIEKIRAELGCPRGYLLSSATLEPRKNLGLLCAAWLRLVELQGSAPPLLLTGAPGWKNAGLSRRLEELRPLGVRHLGYLDRAELLRVIQAASVFVYPSLYEGFGLPPLEAMACGVPTIVSDCTSLPEVVADGAMRVPATDPSAWASALRTLLDDHEAGAKVAALGIARARQFSGETAAEELERVFFEVLGSRTSSS